MKKLLKLTIVLLLIVCIALSGKVYAASLDCNLEIQTSKTEYSKGEEFTASVYVSGIKSEKGVLALSATLDYDKDSLTLVSMSGKNSWETPTKDVSYNESNGKMALLRSNLGKNDEVIFEMTFKVKEDSDASASISLKEVTIANGVDTQKAFETIQKELTVKEVASNPPADNPGTDKPGTDKPGTDTPSTDKPADPKPVTPSNNTSKDKNNTNTNTNKNTNTNTNSNTNQANTNTNASKNTNTNSNRNVTDMTAKNNGSIPKTGITSNPVLMTALATVTASGLYFYTKINFIDKKAKKIIIKK